MRAYNKVIAILFTLFLSLFGAVNVNAKEPIVFTSSNGVELTAKEYNFLVNMYNKDFPKDMTQEEYEFFSVSMLFDVLLICKSLSAGASPCPTGLTDAIYKFR